ncbi:MAG TPA: hypothetical protein VIL07_12570 [Symbiobacteriaceae bacterium]
MPLQVLFMLLPILTTAVVARDDRNATAEMTAYRTRRTLGLLWPRLAAVGCLAAAVAGLMYAMAVAANLYHAPSTVSWRPYLVSWIVVALPSLLFSLVVPVWIYMLTKNSILASLLPFLVMSITVPQAHPLFSPGLARVGLSVLDTFGGLGQAVAWARMTLLSVAVILGLWVYIKEEHRLGLGKGSSARRWVAVAAVQAIAIACTVVGWTSMPPDVRAAAAWAPFTPGAPCPAGASSAGPDRALTVERMDIRLQADLRLGRLEGELHAAIRNALSTPVQTLTVRLHPRLQPVRVEELAPERAPVQFFAMTPGWWCLQLPSALRQGETLQLQIGYEGHPLLTDYNGRLVLNRLSPHGLWLHPQGMWFPAAGDVNQDTPWTLTVETSQPLVFAATSTGGATRRWVQEGRGPLPALAAGRGWHAYRAEEGAPGAGVVVWTNGSYARQAGAFANLVAQALYSARGLVQPGEDLPVTEKAIALLPYNGVGDRAPAMPLGHGDVTLLPEYMLDWNEPTPFARRAALQVAAGTVLDRMGLSQTAGVPSFMHQGLRDAVALWILDRFNPAVAQEEREVRNTLARTGSVEAVDRELRELGLEAMNSLSNTLTVYLDFAAREVGVSMVLDQVCRAAQQPRPSGQPFWVDLLSSLPEPSPELAPAVNRLQGVLRSGSS